MGLKIFKNNMKLHTGWLPVAVSSGLNGRGVGTPSAYSTAGTPNDDAATNAAATRAWDPFPIILQGIATLLNQR